MSWVFRSLYLAMLLLLLSTLSYGRGYFKMSSVIGMQTIVVNGKPYKIDSTDTRIKTAYPKFDTLSFMGESWGEEVKIYCNFKPDSSYSLIVACCGSTDIVPRWKAHHNSLRVWDPETDFGKIQKLLLDHPSITLKLSHSTPQDSIYGWYADAACFPVFKLLDEKGWKYGTPIKCFYWNNISPFLFFKSQEHYDTGMNFNGVIQDTYPGTYEELGTIFIRCFDNRNYTITYDVATRVMTLVQDKE